MYQPLEKAWLSIVRGEPTPHTKALLSKRLSLPKHFLIIPTGTTITKKIIPRMIFDTIVPKMSDKLNHISATG